MTTIEDLKKIDRIAGGKTVAEAEQLASETTKNIWLNAWSKGISPHYQDERCTDPNQFIAARPDGSEDLIHIDISTRKETVIKNLAPPGRGKYTSLIKISNSARE